MKKVVVKKDVRRIENTLKEMVDTIEDYFNVSPFDFVLGKDPQGSYLLFDRLDNKPAPFKAFGWNFKWMCGLIPRAQYTLRKLEKRHEFSDETMDLCMDSQQFGFPQGVLVGMAFPYIEDEKAKK